MEVKEEKQTEVWISSTNMVAPILQRCLSRPIPVGLIGSPGSGKTDMIFEWAKDNSLPVVALNLSSSSETDTAGVMVHEAGTVRVISPDWVKTLQAQRGVLFLDEITCARKEVADTALTIVQNLRMPNGDLLHPQTIIVLACNASAQVDAYDLSPALMNRCAWFGIEADEQEWGRWLLGDGSAERVRLTTVLAAMSKEEYRTRLQQDPEFDADKKALIRAVLWGKQSHRFQFTEPESFVPNETATTARSLFNLLYFSASAAEMVELAPAFLDSETATLLRAVNATVVNNAANAAFRSDGMPADPKEAAKAASMGGSVDAIRAAISPKKR